MSCNTSRDPGHTGIEIFRGKHPLICGSKIFGRGVTQPGRHRDTESVSKNRWSFRRQSTMLTPFFSSYNPRRIWRGLNLAAASVMLLGVAVLSHTVQAQ